VRVDVDEARRHDAPGGVDRLRRLAFEPAPALHGHDRAVLDRHVADEPLGPRAVDDGAPHDLDVVHAATVPPGAIATCARRTVQRLTVPVETMLARKPA